MISKQGRSASYVVAKSHPPEYLMHKYWARKPHNVLGLLLRDLVPNGGLVLDPFCGSGVFLTEALAAGYGAIGIDLNPVSALLSRVSTAPPDPQLFEEAAASLLRRAYSRFGCEYKADGGDAKTVRYAVHETIASCGECGQIVSARDARQVGRAYRCRYCNSRVYFNLGSLRSTNIFQLVFTDGTVLQGEGQDERIAHQQERAYASRPGDGELFSRYDLPFLTNRRILAFPGMTVQALFTTRAFRFACTFANWINEIPEDRARDAVSLWFTSALAQFSRLIPWRNDLSTGGPAWTVPGFWVAPIHLETNPLLHLEARARRFSRGLGHLRKRLGKSNGVCRIYQMAAQEALDDLYAQDVRVDAVFLDPPYGDSVPYLEFSHVWNAFLGCLPDYEAEIVVSDRIEKQTSWEEYESGLTAVFQQCARVLKPDGHVLVTFNNLQVRAWYALLRALYSAGLRCRTAWYQVPAVVSAKAQFAPRTSFVGDFYGVYQPGNGAVMGEHTEAAATIDRSILRALASRDNVAPKNIVLRSALLAILRENLSPEVLKELDAILDRVVVEQGDFYRTRPEQYDSMVKSVPLLRDIVIDVTMAMLEHGPCKWADLYAEIMEKTDSIGVPSVYEVRKILEGKVIFEGKTVCLQSRSLQGHSVLQKSAG